jgi:hypothetical protein
MKLKYEAKDMMKERKKAYGAFVALRIPTSLSHRMQSSLLHGCQAGFDGLIFLHTHLRVLQKLDG